MACKSIIKVHITEKFAELHGYMEVSDVGRIAIGSSRSELPLWDECHEQVVDRTSEPVRSCDPCHFRGEAFDVVFLAFKHFL